MDKKMTLLIIFLVVALSLLALKYAVKKKNENTEKLDALDTLDYNKVLAKGSRGSEVKSLQKILNQNGSVLKIDGIFGVKTEGALSSKMKVLKTTLKKASQFFT